MIMGKNLLKPLSSNMAGVLLPKAQIRREYLQLENKYPEEKEKIFMILTLLGYFDKGGNDGR